MKTIVQVFIHILSECATVHAIGIAVLEADHWLKQYEGQIQRNQVQPLIDQLEARGFTRQPGNDWLIIYARHADDTRLPGKVNL